MTQNKKQKTKFTIFRFIKFALMSALLIPVTGCCLFIIAVGGIETNLSSNPAFEHLFNRTFEFRGDVFVYKYPYEYDKDVIRIGLPGLNSSMPKSVEDYQQAQEKYSYVICIIKKGTHFRVKKVAAKHLPSGSSTITLYIDLEGYDYGNNRIDAFQLYTGYYDVLGTLDADWVQPVD